MPRSRGPVATTVLTAALLGICVLAGCGAGAAALAPTSSPGPSGVPATAASARGGGADGGADGGDLLAGGDGLANTDADAVVVLAASLATLRMVAPFADRHVQPIALHN